MESVEHLSKWLPWCTAEYSIQDATNWAQSASQYWKDGTDYRFLVEDAKTGQIMRSVGINQVIAQHKRGNLGYWVRKSAINQGICTRAARQVVSFAFDTLGFQRLEIHVHIPTTEPVMPSPPSWAVYTRVLSVISWSIKASLYRQIAIPLSPLTMTSNETMNYAPVSRDARARSGCCGIVGHKNGATDGRAF